MQPVKQIKWSSSFNEKTELVSFMDVFPPSYANIMEKNAAAHKIKP